MVSLWKSIQKYGIYWQLYLIKDLHNVDVFLYGMWSFTVY